MNPFLHSARNRRIRAQRAVDEICDRAEREGRDLLTEDETRDVLELQDEIAALNEREHELTEVEERGMAAARTAGALERHSAARITSEARTYRPDGEHSYFRDLVSRTFNGDAGSVARLQRHAQEVAREARDISRTDGAGGEFVPPAWLMERYAEYARPGRVTADLFERLALPPGTDTLQIPRITTGPQSAPQTADNTAVQETDMVTTSVTAPVRTIAGQQDIALQLLEQSPIAFDEVVFRELIADYARVLDLQCLTGSGAAGQLQGILGLAGTNAITYTDASPTLPELYPKAADAIQQVTIKRFLPPEAIVMHPRRWVWALAALDSQNRPLVVPSDGGPQNAPGTAGDLSMTQAVGRMLGLPIYLDANIPTDQGAGTNEDRILVARFTDGQLYEGSLRTRVLPEVLSGTLTVRLQVYNYVAFAPGRFPSSFSIVAGTGLTPPSL